MAFGEPETCVESEVKYRGKAFQGLLFKQFSPLNCYLLLSSLASSTENDERIVIH